MVSNEPIRILLIDDEKVIREGCKRALGGEQYEIHQAENGKVGIGRMQEIPVDIVLLDLMMPGMDGFSVLSWIKENRPTVTVIVVTGFATVAKAVEAMKQGAFDFVGKPFTPDYIRLVVDRAVKTRVLHSEAAKLREEKNLNLETIAKEQSRLRTIFGCMEGAVLVTNKQGIVVLHNPAAIRMLDLQTDPVIGKPLSDSILDHNASDMVREVMQAGRKVTRDFPPGSISRYYLRAHCAPVRVGDGQALGSVTVFEDLTPHKQIDQHKNEFVAMVAHDLRAPLASIIQMVYTIQKCGEQDLDRRRHLLERISERLHDQLQMIENLLSLSRLDTGAIVLNLEPVSGDGLLGQVVDLVRPKAEGKNIDLQYDPHSQAWWIAVDIDQLRVVLTNILDNAIKYTQPGGTVRLSASVAQSLARIKVEDTGIGISPEDLPHIFDRFFRVKGKQTRGITGSGLGLSLVKKVIEAHNGSVEVTSQLAGGTTFMVNLPLADLPP